MKRILTICLIVSALAMVIGCGSSSTSSNNGADYIVDLSGGGINKRPDERVETTYCYFVFPAWDEAEMCDSTMLGGVMAYESFRERVILIISESNGKGGIQLRKHEVYITNFDTYFEYKSHEGEMYMIHKVIGSENGKETIRYVLGERIESNE